MKIAGGKKVSVDGSGALRIETGGSGDLQINLPRIYQEVDGEKRSVVVNSIFGKPLHRNLQKTGPVEDARLNRIPSFGPASSADLRPFSWS